MRKILKINGTDWVNGHFPFNAEHTREHDPVTNDMLLTFGVPDQNLIGERDSAGTVVV